MTNKRSLNSIFPHFLAKLLTVKKYNKLKFLEESTLFEFVTIG